MSREEFLWVEKYRPATIDECVLPEGLKKTFRQFVENKEIPNLLLSGTAGIGKTTVARALCEQLECDYIMINGSEESGIDVLRNKIKGFASTVSLSGGSKVVILDEADYLNPQSTQPALRGFVEEFSSNCRFILTCNFANKLIPPIHSRCSVIEFKIDKKEFPDIASSFFDRIVNILKLENVKHSNDVVRELLVKHYPDWRRVINELQRYGASGTIDSGILIDFNEKQFKDLVQLVKEKKFTDMRRWVVDNLNNDPHMLYRRIYDSLINMLKPQSIPKAVVIIAEYSYKSAFVADQEINLIACLAEIMGSCEFA